MRLATLRRGRRGDTQPGLVGAARLDRRTTTLIGRLTAGDIAIIDHVDLDRSTAEALVAARVGAVVNAVPSISGRYPNLGPEILLAAGVPLIDGAGHEVFASVRDGTRVRLEGDTLYVGEIGVATGTRQTPESVAVAMEDAKEGLSSQLETFAADTREFMLRERSLLLDGTGIPAIRTDMSGRQVVVVARGFDDRQDLAALRPYLREYQPVLVGVGAGADILLDAGHRPALIVGDLSQVSDRALRCGAEVVAHLATGDRADALERVHDLGVAALTFTSTGSSEDLALLLADTRGATLIVGVGTHATLTEFLDRGRAVMASTFLTRLRVGGKLVDAKAVQQLFRSRISGGALLLLALAAVVSVVAALVVSAAGDPLVTLVTDGWHRVGSWAGNLIR